MYFNRDGERGGGGRRREGEKRERELEFFMCVNGLEEETGNPFPLAHNFPRFGPCSVTINCDVKACLEGLCLLKDII